MGASENGLGPSYSTRRTTRSVGAPESSIVRSTRRPSSSLAEIWFYITRERLGRFALIECRPKTGRMHQIRVHLTHIGHPLVGDRVYSGRNRVAVPREAPPLKRHALHASALAFLHPVTGEEMRFERDMPADMEGFLQWARQKTG